LYNTPQEGRHASEMNGLDKSQTSRRIIPYGMNVHRFEPSRSLKKK
jgi:hypothetical protein